MSELYKHIDKKIINGVNLKLYTWNHEHESIQLISVDILEIQ